MAREAKRALSKTAQAAKDEALKLPCKCWGLACIHRDRDLVMIVMVKENRSRKRISVKSAKGRK